MISRHIFFPEKGVVELRGEPLSPAPAPMHARVRSEASLISAGTELAVLHGQASHAAPPCKSGYANVGTIEKLGAGISDFAVGQRVIFGGKHADVQDFLHGENHRWARLFAAPNDLEAPDLAFVPLAAISFTAVLVCDFKPGDSVAVWGGGLIGNLAAQLFRIGGARVLLLDPNENRVELAKNCGLEAVAASGAGAVQAVKNWTNGAGADVCVDGVGHVAVIETASQSAANFGQIALLGSARAPYSLDEKFFFDVHERGLTIRGAHEWRLPVVSSRENRRSVESVYGALFDFIRRELLQLAPLRSHVVSPHQAPDVYAGLRDNPAQFWGAVMDWRGSLD